jgi:precorrin-2 methylase
MASEEQARRDRAIVEQYRKKAYQELQFDIDREIREKQKQWRDEVAAYKAGAGQMAGFKWGAIWFFGTGLFFEGKRSMNPRLAA